MNNDHNQEPQGRRRAVRLVANWRAAPPPDPSLIAGIDRETLGYLSAMGGPTYKAQGRRRVRLSDGLWITYDYVELTGQDSAPLRVFGEPRRSRQAEIDRATSEGVQEIDLLLEDTL